MFMCNFNKNKKFLSNLKRYVNNWTLHNARKCRLNGLCKLGYCCIGSTLKMKICAKNRNKMQENMVSEFRDNKTPLCNILR